MYAYYTHKYMYFCVCLIYILHSQNWIKGLSDEYTNALWIWVCYLPPPDSVSLPHIADSLSEPLTIVCIPSLKPNEYKAHTLVSTMQTSNFRLMDKTKQQTQILNVSLFPAVTYTQSLCKHNKRLVVSMKACCHFVVRCGLLGTWIELFEGFLCKRYPSISNWDVEIVELFTRHFV